MNAKEAHARAAISRNTYRLINEIKKAADDGYFYITEEYVNQSVQLELEALGYLVTYHKHMINNLNCGYWEISWNEC